MTDKTPVHVRPLQAADRSRWNELWTGYLDYYETTLPPEIYDVYFDRLLGDDPRCYLQDLYADPDVRGLGIGRALIEAVYAAADAAGAPSVYWLTQDFNHTARKLYDRIGTKSPFIKYTRG